MVVVFPLGGGVGAPVVVVGSWTSHSILKPLCLLNELVWNHSQIPPKFSSTVVGSTSWGVFGLFPVKLACNCQSNRPFRMYRTSFLEYQKSTYLNVAMGIIHWFLDSYMQRALVKYNTYWFWVYKSVILNRISCPGVNSNCHEQYILLS